MSQKPLVLTVSLAAFVLLGFVQIQMVKEADANPVIPYRFSVQSPLNGTEYASACVPLDVVIKTPDSHFYNKSISAAVYSLDGNANVSLVGVGEGLDDEKWFVTSANTILHNLSEGTHELKVTTNDSWTNHVSSTVFFTVNTPSSSSSSSTVFPTVPEFPSLMLLPLGAAVFAFFLVLKRGGQPDE